MEPFRKSSLTTPVGILEECIVSRNGCNWKPCGTGRLKLNRRNCKFYSINMLESGLICSRDFSSFKNKPGNIFLRHKASWTHGQKEQCLKCSLTTKCKLSKLQVLRRGFHNSLFPFAKSDFNKPSACKKMDKICKTTKMKKTDECDRPCTEKSDLSRQVASPRSKEKPRRKPKMENKIVDPACKKTCLPPGRCEVRPTVPPPKMTYAKVTCPPPKLAKPKSCPPMHLEHLPNDNKSHKNVKSINARKKQICIPPPLPKPPYAPVVLCPCPPPRKVHPGPCPCYETKEIAERPTIRPCKLKKKYPCPNGVFYCPPQKKPCNLKRETGCEHRKKKEVSAS